MHIWHPLSNQVLWASMKELGCFKLLTVFPSSLSALRRREASFGTTLTRKHNH